MGYHSRRIPQPLSERHYCGCCAHWEGWSAFLPIPEDNKALCYWPQVSRGIDQPKKAPVFAKGIEIKPLRMYPDEGQGCPMFLDSKFDMPKSPTEKE